jgi:hypothetical protein
MGQKVVCFSDLSGDVAPEDGELARLVIHEHPELSDGSVQLEALVDEVKALVDAPTRFVTLDLYVPGEDGPRRLVVDADVFDQLATSRSMSEVLAEAEPAKRAGAAAAKRTERINYATLEHAGKPHKGKTTDVEKQLVRDHFDEVNERLQADGMRLIELTDPDHVDRYELAELVTERGAPA